MNKDELITFSAVAVIVVAGIYIIVGSKAAANVGSGIGQGATDAGEGIGEGVATGGEIVGLGVFAYLIAAAAAL